MARKRCQGDLEMADACGKMPRVSVGDPASLSALDVSTVQQGADNSSVGDPASLSALDVTTVQQGADNSTSSNPAPNDTTDSNQPNDNLTAVNQVLDNSTSSAHALNNTTDSNQPNDNLTVANQWMDMSMPSSSNLALVNRTDTNQPTDITVVNQVLDNSTSSNPAPNDTTDSNQPNDKLTVVKQGKDKSTALSQALDDMTDSMDSTNSSAREQGIDKSTSSNHALDETTDTNQSTDNLAIVKQKADKSTTNTNQFTSNLAIVKQGTDKSTTNTNQFTTNLAIVKQGTDKSTTNTNQSTSNLAIVKQSTDKSTTNTNQSTSNLAIVKQGTDKSTPSNQAIGDTTDPNQPTDSCEVVNQGTDMFMPSSSNLTLGDRTDTNQSADNLTSVKQVADKCVSSNQAPDDSSDSFQPRGAAVATQVEVADKSTFVSQAPDDTTDPNQSTDNIEPVKQGKDSGEDIQADFSTLPPEIWVKICSLLSERDRLVMSVTCRTLHRVCKESSVLWRTAVMEMSSNKKHQEFELTATGRSVMRAHAHQMTSMQIIINCKRNLMIGQSSHHLLCEAASRWPLKRLILHVNVAKRNCYSVLGDAMEDLLYTCLTSIRASQLTHLLILIQDWANEQDKSGILEALKNALFTSTLTTLHLGLPIFDESGELCSVIGRFNVLKTIVIPYEFLSNRLLKTFSKRLKSLYFIVNKWDTPREATNWPNLLSLCPRLSVGLHIAGVPPFSRNQGILPSDAPVSEINISHTDKRGVFLRLVPHYFPHLKVLAYMYLKKGRVYQLDEVLISTVSQCPMLDHLVFYGVIKSDTVLTLATMRQWVDLRFQPELVIFADSSGDRVEKLQALCVEVSRTLGRDWKFPPKLKVKNVDPTPDGHTTRPLVVTVRPGPVNL